MNNTEMQIEIGLKLDELQGLRKNIAILEQDLIQRQKRIGEAASRGDTDSMRNMQDIYNWTKKDYDSLIREAKVLTRELERLKSSPAPVVQKPPIAESASKNEDRSLSADRERKKPIHAGTAESLVKRGFLFLEEFKFEKAFEYFDNALDINPEYALAYVGLLCAELKMAAETDLGNYIKPLDNITNYKLALRFADDAYRDKLISYNQKIKECIAEEERQKQIRNLAAQRHAKEELYVALLNEKNEEDKKKVPDINEYLKLAEQFQKFDGYKNAVVLSNECKQKTLQIEKELIRKQQVKNARVMAERHEKEVFYKDLLKLKNEEDIKETPSVNEYRKLIERFSKISEYNDVAALIKECEQKIQQIEKANIYHQIFMSSVYDCFSIEIYYDGNINPGWLRYLVKGPRTQVGNDYNIDTNQLHDEVSKLIKYMESLAKVGKETDEYIAKSEKETEKILSDEAIKIAKAIKRHKIGTLIVILAAVVLASLYLWAFFR